MAEPPAVLFGPSTSSPAGTASTWWARLPSGRTLSAPRLGALVLDVEDAMARELPNRPYTLQFDLRSHTAPPRLVAVPGPARPSRAAGRRG